MKQKLSEFLILILLTLQESTWYVTTIILWGSDTLKFVIETWSFIN